MTYRTGRTIPNTLYDGDVFIGSAITGHKARQLVDAANGSRAKLDLFAGFFRTVQSACETGNESHVLDVVVEATEKLATDLAAIPDDAT